MPRRNNVHPSLRANNVVEGGPDGTHLLDQIEDEIENMDFDDGGPEDGEELEPRAKADPRDKLIESLQRRLDHLERTQAPVAPRQQEEPEADPFDEIDWDEELFKDPKGALKKFGQMTTAQIKKQMRTEYDQDQSSKSFWNNFYARHTDLKDDHDLVESTLGKNMSQLANMPSDEAIDKLADLTRDRISRYSGRGQEPRRKATAEGASDSAPSQAQRASVRPKVETMSDLINLRRRQRLTRRSTAA